MYTDGTFESGGMRLLRRLAASFRVGIFFRVEVRVYWLTLVIVPLVVALEFARWGLPAVQVLTLTVLFTGWLYVIVWTHEMGHILAGRHFGIHTPLIMLSPLGGVAHLAAAPGRPREDVWISLAGPAVHLLWLAVSWPLSLLVDPSMAGSGGWVVESIAFTLQFLVRANLCLLVFNLLPFFPMDGGRVLRAVLCSRMHVSRATLLASRVGMVGAAGFVIYGFVAGEEWGWILVAIGITNFLACRRERFTARHGAGPYTVQPRDPWQTDPDAWKGGRGAPAARSPGRSGRSGRVGPLARWRERRREKAGVRRHEDAERLRTEVDRILARVSEVGLGGLTRRERATLERVSRRARKR